VTDTKPASARQSDTTRQQAALMHSIARQKLQQLFKHIFNRRGLRLKLKDDAKNNTAVT